MQHSEENGCKYTVVKKLRNPEYNIECGNELFTIDELKYLILSRALGDKVYSTEELYPPEIQHIDDLRKENHWRDNCDKEATEKEKTNCEENKKTYKQFLQTKIAKLMKQKRESLKVPLSYRASHAVKSVTNRASHAVKSVTRKLRLTANNRGGKTRKQKHKKRRR